MRQHQADAALQEEAAACVAHLVAGSAACQARFQTTRPISPHALYPATYAEALLTPPSPSFPTQLKAMSMGAVELTVTALKNHRDTGGCTVPLARRVVPCVGQFLPCSVSTALPAAHADGARSLLPFSLLFPLCCSGCRRAGAHCPRQPRHPSGGGEARHRRGRRGGGPGVHGHPQGLPGGPDGAQRTVPTPITRVCSRAVSRQENCVPHK